MIAALVAAWFLVIPGDSANLPVRYRGDNTSCEGSKIPTKFQGYWNDETGHIKISAITIDFCLNPRSTIISIDPSDESCQMLLVKYSTAPARDETQLWYLTKVFGRQILIMVHAESRRTVSVYQRGRTWRRSGGRTSIQNSCS